jgi:hypothetical protein
MKPVDHGAVLSLDTGGVQAQVVPEAIGVEGYQVVR